MTILPALTMLLLGISSILNGLTVRRLARRLDALEREHVALLMMQNAMIRSHTEDWRGR